MSCSGKFSWPKYHRVLNKSTQKTKRQAVDAAVFPRFPNYLIVSNFYSPLNGRSTYILIQKKQYNGNTTSKKQQQIPQTEIETDLGFFGFLIHFAKLKRQCDNDNRK